MIFFKPISSWPPTNLALNFRTGADVFCNGKTSFIWVFFNIINSFIKVNMSCAFVSYRDMFIQFPFILDPC